MQPDKQLRLVRVCEPTATAAFAYGSHNQVMRCTHEDLKSFHTRLHIVMHDISSRSFSAAIFHASMCRFAFPAHPDVKSAFDILAELTRKVPCDV